MNNPFVLLAAMSLSTAAVAQEAAKPAKKSVALDDGPVYGFEMDLAPQEEGHAVRRALRGP